MGRLKRPKGKTITNHPNNLELFEKNQGLVGYMYDRLKPNYHYLEAEDFLQELRMLLWKAIELWNPSKGRLSTYYFYTARNGMLNYAASLTSNFHKRQKDVSYDLIKYKLNRICKPIEITNDIIIGILGRYNWGEHKETMYDFYLHGLTCKEIAKKKKVSRQSVSELIHKLTYRIKRDRVYLRKYTGEI